MRRRLRLPNPAILLPGILLTLLVGTMCLWPPTLVIFLEGKIYDSFLRSAPHRPPVGQVTIVDIDEATLESVGQWPWPRYRVALLLGKIREAGAAAVGLDMVFAEPDRTSLTSLAGEIRRDFGAKIDLRGLPDEALYGDRALAETLAGSPFVLGYQFDFDAPRGESCVLHPLRTVLRSTGGTRGEAGLFDAPGVVCNLPVLARSVDSSGFFNVTPDPDGVLRRIPLLIRHQGQIYPSLALAVYLRARGGVPLLQTGQEGVEALLLEGRRIPLDRGGNLLVNYRGRRRTFPHVSAVALLEGTAGPAALQGKMVMLGTTAAGLKEIRTTPLEASQPGVEIQATVMDNLLGGDPIAVLPRSRGIQLLLVLVPGLLLTVIMARARAMWGLAAIIPATAGIWLGAYWLLARRQVFLPPLLPVVTLLLVFLLLTSIRFLQADREVRVRTRKLALTQGAIIQSLASLAETRHHETGGHIQRTRHFMRVLADRLKDHPRFRHYLDDTTVDLLFRLAPLHDIGKVGVPDEILLKPGQLTPEEFERMKRHTQYGSETIRMAKNLLGGESFLQLADEITLNHHEKWDGTGYPRGLKGEEIPIPGRIMAVADVYDAITHFRSYQVAISHEEAVRIMIEYRGTHFDPDVLDAFLEVQEEFRQIAARYHGPGMEPRPPAGKGT